MPGGIGSAITIQLFDRGKFDFSIGIGSARLVTNAITLESGSRCFLFAAIRGGLYLCFKFDSRFAAVEKTARSDGTQPFILDFDTYIAAIRSEATVRKSCLIEEVDDFRRDFSFLLLQYTWPVAEF